MSDDLISRDAAVKMLVEKANNYIAFTGIASSECNTARVVAIECATSLKSMPTVDAEPVRHGRWEPMVVSSGRASWKCSECGRRARGKLKNLPYCHCGAKMDRGAEGL